MFGDHKEVEELLIIVPGLHLKVTEALDYRDSRALGMEEQRQVQKTSTARCHCRGQFCFGQVNYGVAEPNIRLRPAFPYKHTYFISFMTDLRPRHSPRAPSQSCLQHSHHRSLL